MLNFLQIFWQRNAVGINVMELLWTPAVGVTARRMWQREKCDIAGLLLHFDASKTQTRCEIVASTSLATDFFFFFFINENITDTSFNWFHCIVFSES